MPDDRSALDAAVPGSGHDRRRAPSRTLLGAAALIAAVGLVYLGVCIADVARQADDAAVAFSTTADAVVDVVPGESRIIYLDPVLTGPMSMEVQPGDLECRAEQGATSVPLTERHESRYVRSERPSSSIAEITATEAGELRISCRDHAGRSLPLLLATPGPAVRPLFDPLLGTLVALVLAGIAAAIAIGAVVVARREPPTPPMQTDPPDPPDPA